MDMSQTQDLKKLKIDPNSPQTEEKLELFSEKQKSEE